MTKKEEGNLGEDLAADLLMRTGHHIMQRQWRHGHLELDIIAQDNATAEMVFVEVKTRASDQYGDPLEAVDNKKIRHICDAANFYLRQYNVENDYRFDIITVIGVDTDKPVVTHYKDAFYPPLQ